VLGVPRVLVLIGEEREDGRLGASFQSMKRWRLGVLPLGEMTMKPSPSIEKVPVAPYAVGDPQITVP
jgi:hypothetical protein